MAVNGPANVLVCGHSDGRISLRAVWNLQQTHIVSHSAHGAIKCLWFTEGTYVCTCVVYDAFLILFLSFICLPRHFIFIFHSYLISFFSLIFPSLLITDYQFLLIGSADGTVSIGTDPDVRWKLLHAAIQKTPLLGPSL